MQFKTTNPYGFQFDRTANNSTMSGFSMKNVNAGSVEYLRQANKIEFENDIH